MQTVFQKNLHWTICLHCIPAIWANTYKWVPGIVFQPIILRLSSFNWSCAAIAPSALWSIRTVYFGPIKLQEFGVFTCVKIGQSGTRGRDFCLYMSAPLWLIEHNFPFHQRLNIIAPQLELKHQDVLPIRVEQTRAEQSCLAEKGSCLRATCPSSPFL